MNRPLPETVEVAPGIHKPLTDCTPDDIAAAAEVMRQLMERKDAQIEALRSGRTPKCDWRGDGRFCENDGDYVTRQQVPSPQFRVLCAEHLPSGEGPMSADRI
jgi:hypothetical protein